VSLLEPGLWDHWPWLLASRLPQPEEFTQLGLRIRQLEIWEDLLDSIEDVCRSPSSYERAEARPFNNRHRMHTNVNVRRSYGEELWVQVAEAQ